MKRIILSILLIVGIFNMNLLAKNKVHKVVIQVSTDDARTQRIALNNAVNLQKLYGKDNVDIEIVAYGPGLGILTASNKQSKRVTMLSKNNITFSACMNTMSAIKRKKGHFPKLSKGVGKVSAGVGRIIELQEKGYSYIRP